MSRNSWLLLIVVVIFALALAVVFPIERGLLSHSAVRLGLDLQGGTRLVYRADLSNIPEKERAEAMNGAIAVLENRINPLGVTEPRVERLGENQILVEVPGRSLTDAEKDNLANVAVLEFGELITDNITTPTWSNSYGDWKPAMGTVDNVTLPLTSAYFNENTYVTTSSLGEVLLIFQWD